MKGTPLGTSPYSKDPICNTANASVGGCLTWVKSQIFRVKCQARWIPGSAPLLLRRPSHGDFISYSQASSLSPIPLGKLVFNCSEHSSQERWVPIPALPPVLCGLAALSRARLRFLADLGWEGTVSLKTRSPQKKKKKPPVPAACPASGLGVRITSMPTYRFSGPSCLFPPLGQG